MTSVIERKTRGQVRFLFRAAEAFPGRPARSGGPKRSKTTEPPKSEAAGSPLTHDRRFPRGTGSVKKEAGGGVWPALKTGFSDAKDDHVLNVQRVTAYADGLPVLKGEELDTAIQVEGAEGLAVRGEKKPGGCVGRCGCVVPDEGLGSVADDPGIERARHRLAPDLGGFTYKRQVGPVWRVTRGGLGHLPESLQLRFRHRHWRRCRPQGPGRLSIPGKGDDTALPRIRSDYACPGQIVCCRRCERGNACSHRPIREPGDEELTPSQVDRCLQYRPRLVHPIEFHRLSQNLRRVRPAEMRVSGDGHDWCPVPRERNLLEGPRDLAERPHVLR